MALLTVATRCEAAEEQTAVVRGHVVAKSDVSSIPDEPFADGRVFAVQGRHFPELLRRVGIDSTIVDLQFTRFTLETAQHFALVEAHTGIDLEGRYALELRPGSYMLCLTTPGELDAKLPSARVLGCVRAETRRETPLQLNIGFGEMGLISLP